MPAIIFLAVAAAIGILTFAGAVMCWMDIPLLSRSVCF